MDDISIRASNLTYRYGTLTAVDRAPLPNLLPAQPAPGGGRARGRAAGCVTRSGCYGRLDRHHAGHPGAPDLQPGQTYRAAGLKRTINKSAALFRAARGAPPADGCASAHRGPARQSAHSLSISMSQRGISGQTVTHLTIRHAGIFNWDMRPSHACHHE